MPQITFIDRSEATGHFSCSTLACMRSQRPTSTLCMYGGGVCHNAQSISLFKSWSDVICMCMTVLTDLFCADFVLIISFFLLLFFSFLTDCSGFWICTYAKLFSSFFGGTM